MYSFNEIILENIPKLIPLNLFFEKNWMNIYIKKDIIDKATIMYMNTPGVALNASMFNNTSLTAIVSTLIYMS